MTLDQCFGLLRSMVAVKIEATADEAMRNDLRAQDMVREQEMDERARTAR